MDSLFVEGANKFFSFLKKNNDSKKFFYEKLGFSLSGTISFRDWEVLVAILMRDKHKPGNSGCDLMKHEVKSAKMGNSFEYQYHKHTGLDKLNSDKAVDHIFVSYNESYDTVEVRRILSKDLSLMFETWRSDIVKSYCQESPKQRCRHSITFNYVKTHGELLWMFSDLSSKY